MKSLFEQLGIAFFGLMTTILTVVATRSIAHWIHFDFVGISINLIPVGAIVAGALAASGYYFGAIYTQNKANLSLLILMVIVAGLAEVLGLWLDYILMEVRGEPMKNLVSFTEFCSLVFENTGIHLAGRGIGYRSIDHVGWFGYVLAARQFIGYLIGGFLIYLFLQSEKTCPLCNVYLKKMGEHKHIFPDDTSAIEHIERVKKEPADFLNMGSVTTQVGKAEKVEPESFQVSAVLMRCPICKYRVINQDVSIYTGNEWKKVVSASTEFKSGEVEGVARLPEQQNQNIVA